MEDKDERSKIVEATILMVSYTAMTNSTPKDWAEASVGGVESTLPVTLRFPEKFVKKVLETPGGQAAMNLFVVECIVSKLSTTKEGALKMVERLLKVSKEVKEVPIQKVTEDFMKRIVIN